MDDAEHMARAGWALHKVIEASETGMVMSKRVSSILVSGYTFTANMASAMCPEPGDILKCAGSMSDGVGWFPSSMGKMSDMDMMFVIPDMEVRVNPVFNQPDIESTLLMEPCINDPGYVKLKLIQGTLRDNSCYQITVGNCTYFSNRAARKEHTFWQSIDDTGIKTFEVFQKLQKLYPNRSVDGPSSSFAGSNRHQEGCCEKKMDCVPAIYCPDWPTAADEWTNRYREYDWPSLEFVTQHAASGCYLVAVGCKKCEDSLDWRLSFVHVEQDLVKSFNITQFHCLILLKYLKSFYFEEKFDDVITSYILKTTLFWTIEQTSPDLWCPAKLLNAVHVCLDKLINFVQNDFCPNYFMRGCNLISHRYTTTTQQDVLDHCQYVRRNTLELLCQCPPFQEEFQSVYKAEGMERPFDRSYNMSEKDLNGLEQVLDYMHLCTLSSIYHRTMPLMVRPAVVGLRVTLHKCRHVLQSSEGATSVGLRIIHLIENDIRKFEWYDRFCCANTEMSRDQCQRSLQYSCTDLNDLTGTLTTCHLHTVAGNYEMCHRILQDLVATHTKTNHRLPMGMISIAERMVRTGRALDDAYTMEEIVSALPWMSDINFIPTERAFLPTPIQMEFSEFYNNVSIDPLVYACFLQFWCSMKLDRNIDKLKARDSIVWACDLSDVTNKAVAYNLLGYCRMQLEEYDEALEAFRMAWKQDFRSRATEYHTVALVNAVLRKGCDEVWPK